MSTPAGRAKIAFVINSIGQGGAERVLSVILAFIGPRIERYEVHLVLLDDLPHARIMPDYVILHTLNAKGGLVASVLQLSACISELKPALIVSFLVRSNLASATVGKLRGIPVVACERMHLSSHLAGRYGPVRLAVLTALLRWAYQFPAIVLGVSTGVTEDLITGFKVPAARAGTVFNPYPIEAIKAASRELSGAVLPPSYFVAMSRLEPSKNHLQLIDAFAAAQVAESLVIIGEGALRERIEARISDLGLSDRVSLVGFSNNPFPILAGATAYVSASLNEGFPNAMVEAMVLGVPVVVSDCPSGPAEILEGTARDPESASDATFGILAALGQTHSLTDGMERIAVSETRAHFAQQSTRRAQDFRAEKVTEQYWAIFDRLSA